MPPERFEDATLEAILRAGERLVWAIVNCPICQREVSIGVMSLAATCGCGAYYVEPEINRRGWYRSRDAYSRGEEPIR